MYRCVASTYPDGHRLNTEYLEAADQLEAIGWMEQDGNLDRVHCDAMNGGYFVEGYATRPTIAQAVALAIKTKSALTPKEASHD